MSASLPMGAFVSLLLLSACQGSDSSQRPVPGDLDERSSGQAVVSLLASDSTESWWLEERLAPWPEFVQDHDLGTRQLVRSTAQSTHQVVWAAAAHSRLTAAVVHSPDAWSAVGFDDARRPFLVRGNSEGALSQIVLDDPALAADTNAWTGSTAPTALRLGILSEDTVRIGGTADEVVISLVSEHNAVLAYRFRWADSQWLRGARTLISPAVPVTPYLPIGATYDNFDAIVNLFSAHLAVAADGYAYVAVPATPTRLKRHNAVFGTQYKPLRSDNDTTNRPSDTLITRIARDGVIAWSRVVGTPDVDDEVYAVAAAHDGHVAVVGRARRERGIENSELHPTITTLDGAGNITAAVVFDAVDSGIAQCAVFSADGALWVGGSEAWAQNPSGFSLYKEGRPLLLRLGSGGPKDPLTVVRQDELLPITQGHAELRSLSVAGSLLQLGGLERGPLTHTGDADRSLIRADGWRSQIVLP